ncbi:group II intron reverse transcriptase/maturase [Gracilibacillus timonensis]|uniref:group II intron reverse transcriptase/maturase n=1 Tax=Gracilibacillus timonensis TaxID=1816696 RepID=UPI0008249876|nr:group II intron reverse transcriptase/maturase [Gracilibacillus timonensis]
MHTKLVRIAELAKSNQKMTFTSLAHLLNVEALKACHRELAANKATGIDQVTKQLYEENLHDNLVDLVQRMKGKKYRPQPVKRTYIEKSDSKKKRPLGIPAYEDKIVQRGIAKILTAIYEQDFLASSFGFRPHRNGHDALKVLNVYIEKRYTNYIVDADIKGFFDHVDHTWLMKFLEHRIADPSLLRLIGRFLKAGYMEQGSKLPTDRGTPQGGLISPILGNIYLHYVLDLWFEKRIRKQYKGKAYIVRYADDLVCCFSYKAEADRFYRELKERLDTFHLEMSEEKTKVLAFGRYAEENSKRKGKKKPDTFDFLGFTHYCSKSQQGKFRVKRKTSRKKMQAKLKQCNQWLRSIRNQGSGVIMDKVQRAMRGYYNYYCITDNSRAVEEFRYQIKRIVFKWFNRRSQRKSFDWEKFQLFLRRFPIPKPKVKVNIYELRK